MPGEITPNGEENKEVSPNGAEATTGAEGAAQTTGDGTTGLPPGAEGDGKPEPTGSEAGAGDAEGAPEGVKDEEWLRTGDETADTAIDLARSSGLTKEAAEEVFGKAVESGKLEDVNVLALTEKIGKEKATLVMAGLRDFYNRKVASTAAAVQAVYTEVGGEDKWPALREWAKAHVPERELDGIRSMLDMGGTAAVLAARELVRLYNADPKTSGLNNNLTTGEAAVSTSSEPLSRAEYLELVKQAYSKGDTAEVQRLNARRLAAKNSGN